MPLKKTSVPVQEYSEAFKRQVVSEYERGIISKGRPMKVPQKQKIKELEAALAKKRRKT